MSRRTDLQRAGVEHRLGTGPEILRLASSRPIHCLRGDDPTNSAFRIRDITAVTGNNVDMCMSNCLARSLTIVDADVERVWLELLSQEPANDPYLNPEMD